MIRGFGRRGAVWAGDFKVNVLGIATLLAAVGGLLGAASIAACIFGFRRGWAHGYAEAIRHCALIIVRARRRAEATKTPQEYGEAGSIAPAGDVKQSGSKKLN